MPLPNEHDELAKARKALLKQLIGDNRRNDTASLLSASHTINESASHDFTVYDFLHEPLRIAPESALFESYELDLFKQAAEAAVVEGFEALLEGSEALASDNWVVSVAQGTYRSRFEPTVLPIVSDAITAFQNDLRDRWLSAFILRFTVLLGTALAEEGRKRDIESLMEAVDSEALWLSITEQAIFEANERSQSDTVLNNQTRTSGQAHNAPFEADTVNFGLQKVYRQVWIPLGTQAGEIVRTIPLGPGQTEKVSVKVTRKSRVKRSFEQSTEKESNQESTSTTRDSSEVVDEAANSFNWKTDVSASANWGWGKAEVSAGMGGEQSEQSRSTKNNLNEAMSKSADKLRTQTKVSVETETSEEFEHTQVSEIKNENDEVAVTYVYSKLQRQYEIYTYLAEVNTVVYVATSIPGRREIDQAWLGRYHHILRAHLIDRRFEADIDQVIHYVEPMDEPAPDRQIESIVRGLANRGLPKIDSTPGTPPDVVNSALSHYSKELEHIRSKRALKQAFSISLERLRDHIEAHALHYGRAIASSEDADRRMMRYAGIKVPLKWQYQSRVFNYNTGDLVRPGAWMPSDNTQDWIALSDIIDPSGPIGYAGNYLVFSLRNRQRLTQDIETPLALMRTPYLARRGEFTPSEHYQVLSVVSVNFIVPAGGVAVSVTLIEAEESDTLTAMVELTGNDSFYDQISLPLSTQGGMISTRYCKIDLRPQSTERGLKVGDKLNGQLVMLPRLEDPDLAQLRWSEFDNLVIQNDALFTDAFFESLVDTLPEQASTLLAYKVNSEQPLQWANLTAIGHGMVRTLYPDYLFNQQSARRFLLDTDNLMLTRIMDDQSSLEPFKGLHRYLDVIGAFEDVAEKQYENIRKSTRIDKSLLNDPDIESQTVVMGMDNIDIDI